MAGIAGEIALAGDAGVDPFAQRVQRLGQLAGGAADVAGDPLRRQRADVRSPRIRRMLTNCIDAYNHETVREEILGSSDAMLEFETEIDGVLVNGVDIINWNETGQIVEFKVMIRPLKAVNLIHERMGAMLAAAHRKA